MYLEQELNLVNFVVERVSSSLSMNSYSWSLNQKQETPIEIPTTTGVIKLDRTIQNQFMSWSKRRVDSLRFGLNLFIAKKSKTLALVI